MIVLKAFNIFLNTPSGRARFVLWFGFGFNLLYALWGLGTGIFYRSAWFGAMAVYYLLLCTLKFFIIKTDMRYKQNSDSQKSELKALRRYKNCGWLLGLLNLFIVGIVILIIKRDESAKYSGIVLWVMGGYTAVRMVISALNLRRLRDLTDPLLSASKTLGISVTLMSMFSLQTALLERFCRDEALRRELNGLVGFAICIMEIALAIYMITKSKSP